VPGVFYYYIFLTRNVFDLQQEDIMELQQQEVQYDTNVVINK